VSKIANKEPAKDKLQKDLEIAIKSHNLEGVKAALDAGANPTKLIFDGLFAPLAFAQDELSYYQRFLNDPQATEQRAAKLAVLEGIIKVLEEYPMIKLGKAIAAHSIVCANAALEFGANPLMSIPDLGTPLEYAEQVLNKLSKSDPPKNSLDAQKRENAIKDLKEIIILLQTRAGLLVGSDKFLIMQNCCADAARKICNGDKSMPPGKVPQKPKPGLLASV